MMKKLNLITVIIICLLGSLSIGKNIYANDDTQPMGGYTIEGVANDHQIDKNASYFHLFEQPLEEDKIKVKLINDSTHDKRLSVKVVDANTNINGNIDYTGNLKNWPQLKEPLTSVLKAEQPEIIVPKQSNVETVLNLKMPSTPFKGIILGGIVVSEVQEATKQSNVTMTNTYNYTLGVVLTNTDTIETKNNISVSLEKVGPKLFDGRKVVEANILNDHPFIFSNGKVSAMIKEKKSGEIVKKTSKDKISIAPYSAYPLQFDWEKADLKPGTYIFSALFEDGKRSWKLEKEFTIGGQEAKEINKKSVFQVFIPLWIKIAAILSFILTLIFLIYNSKKLKEV